jgi:hypothetical protein
MQETREMCDGREKRPRKSGCRSVSFVLSVRGNPLSELPFFPDGARWMRVGGPESWKAWGKMDRAPEHQPVNKNRAASEPRLG